MWVVFAIGCGAESGGAAGIDPASVADPDPPPPEEPCSRSDEDGDGLPNSEHRCTRTKPDVILDAPSDPSRCCVRWAMVPDLDLDGRADVFVELQYDLARDDEDGTVAWLLPGTTSGRADELAFASFRFTDLSSPGLYVAPIAGEFDGAPGTDAWIRSYLFTGLAGAMDVSDAVADVAHTAPAVAAADLDLDGIDDLVFQESFESGTYHSGGTQRWNAVSIAVGPFDGVVFAEDVVDERSGGATRLLDADGAGAPELAIEQGDSVTPGPVTVVRPDGVEVARFDAPVSPTRDVDGDGFDDVWMLTEPNRNRFVTVLLAGPFSGTIDPDTHPMVASWEAENLDAVPDLDGDGTAEVVWATQDGTEVLREATGRQGKIDAEADGRFHQPAVVNSVPSGGPFVGDFGGGDEADVGLGIIGDDGGWNAAFHIYFEPLY